MELRQRNNDIRRMLSDYLHQTPGFITRELMDSINNDGLLDEETAYFYLLSAACGLDTENDPRDKQLAYEYLRPAVKKLDPKVYGDNPYYRDIRIPDVEIGQWRLTYQSYLPYEAFVYDDIMVEPDFREIPRIGFFNQEFRFPVVMEHGHEWMAIKPNEIETMQPVIDAVEGDVVTFGLGLGYFTYMASLKENVRHVTVVEHDYHAIRLFETSILPQFLHQDKVEIVTADAFDYLENRMPGRNFDCAFVDLWHDLSDGLNPYLKLKKLERFNRRTKFFYWIEDSLLSGFRWQIFDWVIQNAGSYHEILKLLSKPVLQQLAAAAVSQD
ncbi:MAG: hypothetical protein KBA26_05015 [Candidatus Delongbacteria bacterium]|nr:hypothetical protein [Candidatus Delongbacteria bacterium]